MTSPLGDGERGGPRGPAALRVESVSKTFPAQVALDGVSLDLHRGEVRALLGENGSGKSTLIKILAGYHQPDPGWKATAVGAPGFVLGSSQKARDAGLRFIHQNLGIVAERDVVDNLALGQGYAGKWWLGRRREECRARELLSQFGVELDLRAPISTLSPAERTIVALVRALREGLENLILVLDEPTASLPASEVARLFEVLRKVCDQGGAVLYVTHRLQEVLEIADQVTVLRDGREVADRPVAGLGEEELVELIVGRPVDSVFPEPPEWGGEVLLAAEAISTAELSDVSFELRRGEILGVGGIVGSGREILPRVLLGEREWLGGDLRIGDERFAEMSIGLAMAHGVTFAAQRSHSSVIPELLVRENVTLPRIPARRRPPWLGIRSERKDVRAWLQRLDVRPPDPERPLETLSGGNQQRVLLAQCLRMGPRVLLLEEPTHGVDIGAKAEIYRIIGDHARAGGATIVFSSDAEELAAICDRVLVMRSGRFVSELYGQRLTEQSIVKESVIERGEAVA